VTVEKKSLERGAGLFYAPTIFGGRRYVAQTFKSKL
jgi:hypothetical protein